MTKAILCGSWEQFNNYLRDNQPKAGDDVLYIRDFRSLAGRDRDNIEVIKYGTWYENEEAVMAVEKYLEIDDVKALNSDSKNEIEKKA